MNTELILCSLGAWHGVLGIIAHQKAYLSKCMMLAYQSQEEGFGHWYMWGTVVAG